MNIFHTYVSARWCAFLAGLYQNHSVLIFAFCIPTQWKQSAKARTLGFSTIFLTDCDSKST